MKNKILALTVLVVLSSCGKIPTDPASSAPEGFNFNCELVYDKPGSYVLDRDLNSSTCGIHVKASNVSIDLNGHKIQGPNDLTRVTYGIVSIENSSVKVTNGFIDGFAFGIAITNKNQIGNTVKNNEVTNMEITNSGLRGIQIFGYNAKVDSNKITNTGGNTYWPDAYAFGIEMIGPDCMVSNNEVTDTYGSFNSPGTYIAEGVAISFSFYNTNCVADNNKVLNNRAVTNKSTFGFWVDVYSVVTIKNNNVSGMHYSGIVPPRTTLTNNTTDIPMADGCYDRQ